jgi:hypothetical protein
LQELIVINSFSDPNELTHDGANPYQEMLTILKTVDNDFATKLTATMTKMKTDPKAVSTEEIDSTIKHLKEIQDTTANQDLKHLIDHVLIGWQKKLATSTAAPA